MIAFRNSINPACTPPVFGSTYTLVVVAITHTKLYPYPPKKNPPHNSSYKGNGMSILTSPCKPKSPSGWQEGVARGVSQALTYAIEIQKTVEQVYGRGPQWTPGQWASNVGRGIWQSSLTAGFVYHAYFTIYNALYPSPWAGAVAAFATSVVKVPIGNCMRVLQATAAPTIVHIGINMVRKRGPAALYSGYFLSLVEDVIEMDLRMRIYYALVGPPDAGVTASPATASPATASPATASPATASPLTGLIVGCIAGSVAAAITTPFDTIRSQLAFVNNSGKHHPMTNGQYKPMTSVQVLGHICKKNGPLALYRGAHLRATSIGLKAALFFACLEGLKAHAESKPNPTKTKASPSSHVAAPSPRSTRSPPSRPP